MPDSKPDTETESTGTAAAVRRYIAWLHHAENIFLVFLIATMALLAIVQIFLRNFFHSGMVWAEPMMRSLVLWVAMIGSMVATRENKHIRIDVLNHYLSEKNHHRIIVLTQLFAALVCFVIAWHSLRFVLQETEQTTLAFAFVPTWFVATVIPFAFLVMAIRFALSAISTARERKT